MHITPFLANARFRTSNFGAVICGAPWSGVIPVMEQAVLFAIREGRGYLEVEGHTPAWLDAGDVALIPRGAAHRLCSSPTVKGQSVMEIMRHRPVQTYTLRHGGKGAQTVFCAALSNWDDVGQATVARVLPELIVVRRAEFGARSQTESIVDLLEREARQAREISPLIANHLLNALLTEILFAKFGDAGVRRDLVKSFARPPIARALMLIHSSLATDWTVTELAKRVGMSRSAFTLEFTAVLGLSPGHYLIQQKLSRAAALLKATPHDLATVADLTGYDSVPSFIKAFKRRYGASPGRYRETGGALTSGLRRQG
ncbi:MAG: hypothetical protein DCC73_14245 [Proteobacteria bacterium]|jgi:AraC-like DNA-binding protein|nr:MAG: hypothetical protein DCC73_14245 [Pseudomonadota bacterium]